VRDMKKEDQQYRPVGVCHKEVGRRSNEDKRTKKTKTFLKKRGTVQKKVRSNFSWNQRVGGMASREKKRSTLVGRNQGGKHPQYPQEGSKWSNPDVGLEGRKETGEKRGFVVKKNLGQQDKTSKRKKNRLYGR